MSTRNMCFHGEDKYQYFLVEKSALPGTILVCWVKISADIIL